MPDAGMPDASEDPTPVATMPATPPMTSPVSPKPTATVMPTPTVSPTPSATPDEVLDGGMPDGGELPDGGGMPDGGDGPPNMVFAEEFLDTMRIDADASDARVDGSGVGVAQVPVPELARSTGSDGAFRPTGLGVLEAGDHDFSVVDIARDATVEAPNGARILSRGAMTIAGDIHAGAEGLVLSAFGDLVIESDAVVSSQGPLEIHIVDGLGRLEIRGTVVTEDAPGANSGSLRIYSRGNVTVLDASVLTGDADGRGASGELTLWSGGHLIVTNGAYVASGRNGMGGDSGAVDLRAAGRLEVQGRSEVASGNVEGEDALSGELSLRAGGLLLIQGNDIEAGAAVHSGLATDGGSSGSTTVIGNGRLEMNHSSRLFAGDVDTGVVGALEVWSMGLEMLNESLLQGGSAQRGEVSTIHIRVRGDVDIESRSFLQGGRNTCSPGGHTVLEATGNLTVSGGSAVRGGASSRASGCNPDIGGDLTVRIGGALSAGPLDVIAGTGGVDMDGERTLETNAEVAVSIPPPRVWQLQSVPIDSTLEAPEYLSATALTSAFPLGSTLTLELSTGPSAEGPWSNWAQEVAEAGDGRFFRYRLSLGATLFDTPKVDRVVIEYR